MIIEMVQKEADWLLLFADSQPPPSPFFSITISHLFIQSTARSFHYIWTPTVWTKAHGESFSPMNEKLLGQKDNCTTSLSSNKFHLSWFWRSAIVFHTRLSFRVQQSWKVEVWDKNVIPQRAYVYVGHRGQPKCLCPDFLKGLYPDFLRLFFSAINSSKSCISE